MNNDKFLGHNGFLWFVGVVEDRQDPLRAGRIRARALGHHTSDKVQLPTSDLPWAQVVLPITSSGISGIGSSATGLVEGSWVMGYFRDGDTRQEPVILGSLPGKPSEYGNPNKGFYDPNERLDDSGYSVYPREINEPDVNRLAINDTLKQHSSLVSRTADRLTQIATADFNSTTAADGSSIAASDGDTFDQPAIPYNATYPYNHVYESESGHIREYDDTTDHTRIYERHRSGTSYEIDHSGNKVDIIKATHYELVSNDKKVYVAGKSDISIDGRHKIYINKAGESNNHYDIQVGPGANVNIQVDNGDCNVITTNGKINLNSGSDLNMKVAGDMNITVDGNKTENISGSKTSNTTGAVVHRGSTIDLNP